MAQQSHCFGEGRGYWPLDGNTNTDPPAPREDGNGKARGHAAQDVHHHLANMIGKIGGALKFNESAQ